MQQNFFDSTPEIGRSFIYRSSAGSGKTFTLTKAFLKLVLLDPSRYSEILAITFTNKAKDEMKTRIVDELTDLANGVNSQMRLAILEDFKKEKVERIEDVITSRAVLVLSRILHDYSNFNISTIDHFFTRLIRHLAKELKLNLGYELDVDSSKALSESIDLLFSSASDELLNWLEDFSMEQIDNEKGWDVRKNIGDLGAKLFQESYLDIESSLRQNASKLPAFIRLNKDIIIHSKKSLKAIAKIGIDAATKYGLTTKDFTRGTPLNLMENMLGNIDFKKKPSPTFLNATTLESWHTKKSDKVDIISKARDNGMFEAHEAICDFYNGEDYAKFIEAEAILRFIHSYGVLSSLAKTVQEYRSEHNLMFISDSAFVLHNAITEAETPFIYEKIGSNIKYILIDEFQDTSAYQWQSLLPFFNDVVAGGGQVYVVGDVKQSIYGWRGGDLNLLLHQVEVDLKVKTDDILKLNTNYRSAKTIIEFNNAFFKVAALVLPELHKLAHLTPEFELAYADVHQKANKDSEGYVEIQLLKHDADDPWIDQSHNLVLESINKALEDGFKLSDILLLTRKTSEASRIAEFLLQNGIAALSESALKLSSSSKVQVLISTLKYMINPKNSLVIAEFNHFFAKLSRTPIPSLIEVPSKLTKAINLGARPVYELLEELILLFELNSQTDLYLTKFLDLSLQQSQKGVSTPEEFISWWTEQEEKGSQELSLSLPESEKAALVLTVHKAKGLEKPIVILPYAEDEMRPKSTIFWAKPLPEHYANWGSLPLNFSSSLSESGFEQAYIKHYFDNLLESLNLLYVSFTRAAERLYIFGKSGATPTTSSKLIETVLESPAFSLSANYNSSSSLFKAGQKSKSSNNKVLEKNLEIRPFHSYQLKEDLIIEKKQAELFLTLNSEKSEKVREGIILHQILSLLERFADLPTVLDQLVIEKIITLAQAPIYKQKIVLLFDKIPDMKQWFGKDYEVINERKIFSNNKTYIPDRVMIKDENGIIVDYKREKESDKHAKQVITYKNLLEAMGYKNIKMYLIYIDDQKLVPVVE